MYTVNFSGGENGILNAINKDEILEIIFQWHLA